MLRTCPGCGQRNRLPAERLGDKAHCGRCKAGLTPPDAPVELDSPADFDELVGQAALPVLVDFWAPWCGPCRAVAPELVGLAERERGRVVIAKVNTDEMPDVANRFGIRGIPTFILFREGREEGRASGAMRAEAWAWAWA